jgi:hypothetical protein
MPAPHRPHLPRLISVSVAAFTLAVTISLALARSLSNMPFVGPISRPLAERWLTARG